MSNKDDNYEMKVRKGQAYNLAVQSAIQAGKEDDLKFIVKKFLMHLKRAEMFQKATPEQLLEAIDDQEFKEEI